MCGIAGYQGRFEAGLLAAMESCLTHRGPDGGGTLRLEDAAGSHTGLAHRRLSIIDLSAEGAQPMTIRCPACGVANEHDLALSYNGEIYNFPELRRGLERQGHAFHSATDSEVLLHLYATCGLDFLDSLNGIFAFAIRDGRERGRPEGVNRGDLVIARDQLGVKPLYYAVVPEGFLFASELKAILRHPSVPRDLDLVALDQAMSFLWTP